MTFTVRAEDIYDIDDIEDDGEIFTVRPDEIEDLPQIGAGVKELLVSQAGQRPPDIPAFDDIPPEPQHELPHLYEGSPEPSRDDVPPEYAAQRAASAATARRAQGIKEPVTSPSIRTISQSRRTIAQEKKRLEQTVKEINQGQARLKMFETWGRTDTPQFKELRRSVEEKAEALKTEGEAHKLRVDQHNKEIEAFNRARRTVAQPPRSTTPEAAPPPTSMFRAKPKAQPTVPGAEMLPPLAELTGKPAPYAPPIPEAETTARFRAAFPSLTASLPPTRDLFEPAPSVPEVLAQQKRKEKVRIASSLRESEARKQAGIPSEITTQELKAKQEQIAKEKYEKRRAANLAEARYPTPEIDPAEIPMDEAVAAIRAERGETEMVRQAEERDVRQLTWLSPEEKQKERDRRAGLGRLSPAEREALGVPQAGWREHVTDFFAPAVKGISDPLGYLAALTEQLPEGLNPLDIVTLPETIAADITGTDRPQRFSTTLRESLGDVSSEMQKSINLFGGKGLISDVEKAVGGSLPVAAGGMITKAPVVVAGIAGLQQAAQMREEAIAKGVDPRTATQMAQWGIPIGMIEGAFGIGRMSTAVSRQASKKLIRSIAEGFGEELGENKVQRILTDFAAKGTYDPERGIFIGLDYEDLVAGIAGGLFGAGFKGVSRLAERQTTAPPESAAPSGAVSPQDALDARLAHIDLLLKQKADATGRKFAPKDFAQLRRERAELKREQAKIESETFTVRPDEISDIEQPTAGVAPPVETIASKPVAPDVAAKVVEERAAEIEDLASVTGRMKKRELERTAQEPPVPSTLSLTPAETESLYREQDSLRTEIRTLNEEIEHQRAVLHAADQRKDTATADAALDDLNKLYAEVDPLEARYQEVGARLKAEREAGEKKSKPTAPTKALPEAVRLTPAETEALRTEQTELKKKEAALDQRMKREQWLVERATEDFDYETLQEAQSRLDDLTREYEDTQKRLGEIEQQMTAPSAPVAKAAAPTPAVKPEAPAEQTKEPWEMTGREYEERRLEEGRRLVDEYNKTGAYGIPPTNRPSVSDVIRLAEDIGIDPKVAINRPFHELLVRKAIKDRKPVPPEVLADYPDLAAKYGKPSVPPPAPTSPAKSEAPAGRKQELAEIDKRIADEKAKPVSRENRYHHSMRVQQLESQRREVLDAIERDKAPSETATISAKEWAGTEDEREIYQQQDDHLAEMWEELDRDRPVHADYVDIYKQDMPEGYERSGDLLVPAKQAKPSVPAAPPAQRAQPDDITLWTEYQGLVQKLPRNIGQAKSEGKLSAAQLKALERVDEIEEIVGSDRIAEITKQKRKERDPESEDARLWREDQQASQVKSPLEQAGERGAGRPVSTSDVERKLTKDGKVRLPMWYRDFVDDPKGTDEFGLSLEDAFRQEMKFEGFTQAETDTIVEHIKDVDVDASERLAQKAADPIQILADLPRDAKQSFDALTEEQQKIVDDLLKEGLIKEVDVRGRKAYQRTGNVRGYLEDTAISIVSPEAEAEAKPDAMQVLKDAGITVKATKTARGNPVWEVTGDTYPHKDKLKELGGRFYAPKKSWSFYESDPTQRIAEAIAPAGVQPAARSESGRVDRPGVKRGVAETRKEGRILTQRSNLTSPADTSVIPAKLDPHLREHQKQGAAAAVEAMESRGGFLIADGTGCIAAGTRIYNPLTGEQIPVEVLMRKGTASVVLSLTPEGLKPHIAGVPFMKGKERLYRVLMESGREVTVTANHRFLTPDGWKTISEGVAVQQLLASALYTDSASLVLPVSSLGHTHSVHASDALRYLKRPEDCLDGCWRDPCRYDERPQMEEDNGLEHAPLQDDARGHSPLSSRVGDGAISPTHIHPHRRIARHSKSSSSQEATPAHALNEAPACDIAFQQLPGLCQDVQPFHGTSVSLLSSHEDSLHQWASFLSFPSACLPRPLSEEIRLNPSDTDLYSRGLFHIHSTDPSASCHLCTLERLQLEFQHQVSDSACHHSNGWDRIASIEKAGEGEFYDLHVPGAENYVAEGLIHHNTGKTRTMLTTAQIYAERGHPVIIIAPNEVLGKPFANKNRISGSYANDSQAMGVDLKLTKEESKLEPGKIYVTTYHNMSGIEKAITGNTIVIMDEAHALKNLQAGTARARQGDRIASKAKSVLYATATPADKPSHLEYLDRIGVMEGKSVDAQMRSLGLKQVTITTKQKGIEKKVWVVDSKVGAEEVFARMGDLFDRMTEQGAMIKREIAFENEKGEKVPVRVHSIALPAEAHQTLEDIEEGFTQGEEIEGLQKAVMLMHQRRQQEPYKIDKVMELTQEALKKGRQVVIFMSRVNFSEAGRNIYGRDPISGERVIIDREVYASSEGTAKQLRKELRDRGITEFTELHGGAEMKAAQAMDDFQSGKAKVVIATIESGGTGINLDDTTGKAPRTLIVMTAPFSAVENVQAAGRVWRLTTESIPEIHYIFGDTDVDAWNAGIIRAKMGALGAVVKGEVAKLTPEEGEVLEGATTPAKDAWERIKERGKTQRRSGPMSDEDLKDLAIIAGHFIKQGAKTVAEISQKIYDHIKLTISEAYADRVRPFLDEIVAKAGFKPTEAAEAVPTEAKPAEAAPEPHYSTYQSRTEEGQFDGPPSEEYVPVAERETGIKNAVVESERADRGLPMVEKEATVPQTESLERGKQLVDSDPAWRDKVAQWGKEHRQLNTDQQAGILYDRQKLYQEHQSVMDQLEDAFKNKDTASEATLKETIARIESQINDNDLAATHGIAESARAMSFRRRMIKEDYTLARVIQRARLANEGRDLTPETRKQLEDAHKKLEEALNKQGDYEKQIAEMEATIKERTQIEQERVKSQVSEVEQAQNQELNDHISDLESQLEDYKAKVAERDTQHVIRGEQRSVRRERRAATSETLAAERQSLLSELAKVAGRRSMAVPGGLDPKAVKILGQLARNFIRSGVNKAADLVDNVHNLVRDVIEGITRREVLVAISGYGKTSHPNTDPIETKLREIKAQLRKHAAIEDVEAGEPGLRSGYQPDAMSEEVRQLQKQLNKLMREKGIKLEQRPRDKAAQLRTAQDTVKARLRNQIADLDRQIAGEDPTEKKKGDLTREAKGFPKEIYDDAETKAMREQLKNLRSRMQTARNEPKTKARLEAQVAELQRRIRERDFSKPPKKTKPVASAEIEALRTERKELLKAWRQLANPPDPKATSLKNYKKQLQKRLDDLQEMAKTGKFYTDPKTGEPTSTKPTTRTVLDPEAERLKASVTQAKADVDRRIAELKRRSLLQTADIVRRTGMISALNQVANDVISTGGLQPLEAIARYPMAMVDYIRSAFSGRRTISNINPAQFSKLMAEGLVEAVKDFPQAMKTGETKHMRRMGEYAEPINTRFPSLNRVLNLIPHFRNWTDSTTFEGAYNVGQKVFQKVADMNERKSGQKTTPEEIDAQATAFAEMLTFRNDNLVDDMFRRATAGHEGLDFLKKQVQPFVRTMTNYVNLGYQYSGGGILGAAFREMRVRVRAGRLSAKESGKLRDVFKAFGENYKKAFTKEDQLAQAQYLGRGITGLSLMVPLGVIGYLTGWLTGPPDEGEEERDPDAPPPFNVYNPITKTRHDYRILGPGAIAVALGTVIGREWKRGEIDWLEAAKGTRAIFRQAPMIRGVEQFSNFMEPSRIPEAAGRYLTTWYPFSGLLRSTVEATDPLKRDTQGFIDELKAPIPGLRRQIEPMKNKAGPIKSQWWNIIDPSKTTPGPPPTPPVVLPKTKKQPAIERFRDNRRQRRQSTW